MATIGRISDEEAKRRERIAQQKRIEAFEKSKKIKRPAFRKKPMTRSRAKELEQKKKKSVQPVNQAGAVLKF